ncbi:hypothetical protein C3R44_23415, partial [Mycobacterium tuberculosis]|uniref:hypothetical protein n=1 Tax=Mycobacterium tuberculosis TaxID=1773 RepID=UPI000E38F6F1
FAPAAPAAVPAVAAFAVAAPAFASGPPFAGAAARFSVFFGASLLRRFAFARAPPLLAAPLGALLVAGGFALAAVGG